MSNLSYLEEDIQEYRSKNFHAPKGVHIMNKNEKKALRKLKQQTGLTEEKIREVKKYRKILSAAQKDKGNKSWLQREVIYIVKKVTKKIKLPLEHPETIKAIEQEILDIKNSSWKRRLAMKIENISVNNFIEIYRSCKK